MEIEPSADRRFEILPWIDEVLDAVSVIGCGADRSRRSAVANTTEARSMAIICFVIGVL